MDIMGFAVSGIDKLLDLTKKHLGPDFLRRNEDFFADKAAPHATVLSIALTLIAAVIAAIKVGSFTLFLAGVAIALMMVVCYYIGRKFITDCELAIKNNPTQLSTTNFTDMCALMCILGALCIAIGGIYASINLRDIDYLVWAVFGIIYLAYLVCIMVHPSLITTNTSERTTATADALSIMAIFNKIAVRLAKLSFGGAAFFGALTLLIGMFDLINAENGSAFATALELLSGIYLLTFGLLFPFLSYLFFVFFYIIIEVIQSIISLRKT